MFKFYL